MDLRHASRPGTLEGQVRHLTALRHAAFRAALAVTLALQQESFGPEQQISSPLPSPSLSRTAALWNLATTCAGAHDEVTYLRTRSRGQNASACNDLVRETACANAHAEAFALQYQAVMTNGPDALATNEHDDADSRDSGGQGSSWYTVHRPDA